ncbi:hypothetical protein QQF64_022858 [Cirrhinus molitorella]|uniref:Parathyroid hormone n=1 Tax=Cirrhinus molitorella TaxID=172907 RepID=A0ABR3L760_9TELE
MHNLRVHKHVELRQDWLQMKLREIHTASKKNEDKTGLAPDIIPELKDLNPREAEDIIAVLERLMNPSSSVTFSLVEQVRRLAKTGYEI